MPGLSDVALSGQEAVAVGVTLIITAAAVFLARAATRPPTGTDRRDRTRLSAPYRLILWAATAVTAAAAAVIIVDVWSPGSCVPAAASCRTEPVDWIGWALTQTITVAALTAAATRSKAYTTVLFRGVSGLSLYLAGLWWITRPADQSTLLVLLIGATIIGAGAGWWITRPRVASAHPASSDPDADPAPA